MGFGNLWETLRALADAESNNCLSSGLSDGKCHILEYIKSSKNLRLEEKVSQNVKRIS